MSGAPTPIITPVTICINTEFISKIFNKIIRIPLPLKICKTKIAIEDCPIINNHFLGVFEMDCDKLTAKIIDVSETGNIHKFLYAREGFKIK